MSVSLDGCVYVVTGGSKGLGLAIARELVGRGAKVGLIGRNRAALDEAVAELSGAQAMALAADVGSRAAIAQALVEVHGHFGRLDGVVNNAGMARPDRVEDLVEEEVVMQVNTNFLGTVFCCQAAIPLLRGGDNPRIVNISSASAWHYDEISHLSIYASTKAAVERFTRDLRLELQRDGIGVSCIRPGGAITGFADEWAPEKFAAAMESWKDMGTWMDLGMDVSAVGEAVSYALSQPPGAAVDLLEVRPNLPTPKAGF